MKTMMTLMLMLFGASAFAGDKYFICSHIADVSTQEEEFVVDAYLDEKEPETIRAVFQVSSEPKLLYTVEYNHLAREFKASVKSFRSITPLDRITTKLEYGRPVQLSPRLSCFISD